MKALIRAKQDFYCSTVFALLDKGWKSSVIVFDKNISQLIMIPCNCLTRGIRRDVLCFDESKENWVVNKMWQGLDFIINDKNLIHEIKKGHSTPTEILDRCKAMQTTESFAGWNKIETDCDIEKLMNISLDFHDSSIESIERNGDDIYVTFDCWSCRITIKFINLIKCDECKNTNWNINSIFQAIMCFDDGNIKWYVDGFCFAEYENQECYFIAERAQYKIELCNSF